MDLSEALDELRARGKPGAAAVLRRHGIAEEVWGVSYADLNALKKRIKTDHALALDLWRTGIHDARVLATFVADSSVMAVSDIEAWLADAANYGIANAIATLAERMPAAGQLARLWIESDGEWIGAAGWNLIGTQAMSGEWVGAAGWNLVGAQAMSGSLTDDEAIDLLRVIQARIHGSKNFTRYAMNGALIAIGGSMPGAREEALAAARAIGKVEVDHGETDCVTPDTAPYIEKMAARAATRGARVGAKG
ncbi:MAG: alkylation repair protein [Chloroflexi bacterium]|nr:alkylation repair protein [Chloroflexota bacterium]